MDQKHRYTIRKLMNIEKEKYKVEIKSIYSKFNI